MRYVLAYDMVDDRKRTRLADLLLDYGDRVQKSVFEADLTTKQREEVLLRATKILDVGDSFRVYPLCGACSRRSEAYGASAPDRPDECVII